MKVGGLDRHLVSAAILQPAMFGPENFAGDEWVESYMRAASRLLDLEVRTYVTWQCPPDVFVLAAEDAGLVIRSERLDGLLVEMLTLHDVQSLLGGQLLEEVSQSAVLRWMSEFLIGYRRPALAVTALRNRPSLDGLQVQIHHAFRDELLDSRPLLERTAVQCISVGHEMRHLVEDVDARYDVWENIDGIPVISHIDFDMRNVDKVDDDSLQRFHAFVSSTVDATRLVKEIHADLFAVDTVLEFCLRAFDCRSEDAVRSTLAAFETLVFTYFLKNACRLVAELSTGSKRRDEFDRALVLENLQWVARGRAVARHIGLSWAQFDNSTPEGALIAARQNVARVDAMITERLAGRLANNRAFDHAVQALLDTLERSGKEQITVAEALAHVDSDGDLRKELYFMLVGFGCPGSVDVRTYLEDADRTVHTVQA
ncbi:hypothetical protein GA707_03550 [Nostocoides sp. F2B08]|uniref:hypothetical protein n=1 Tax=Nostocoides sp. F2B08 TaxID=2653936 RepID=UPI001263E2A7|nr:hypothetical protein [Tetrasphaera sp. F2B08]KAB7746571.1 hypothetical protein GA707_03550 [Tetrasphaera sp. F2B08]